MFSDFRNQLITALLSVPIVYVPTSDYRLLTRALDQILQPGENGFRLTELDKDCIFEYDCARGMVDFFTKKRDSTLASISTVEQFLEEHINLDKESMQVSVICNFDMVLAESPKVIPLLSAIATGYESNVYNIHSTVILASPTPIDRLPRDIIDIAKVIELPRPTFSEISKSISHLPVSRQVAFCADEIRNEFARNLQGLSDSDIRQIIRSSMVRTGLRLNRQTLALALDEKKLIVKKTGIIEVVDTNESLDNVGGLENLIAEIRRKKVIFKNLAMAQHHSARVPLPKGILVIGMPGCGKSMIAKSIASEFGVALLRLDINRLMGKYVGESETNLRRALETAEAAHPCVLWIDEIEKAFAGTDSGNNDIIIRLMGHFLTWMQERKSAVYVVATANDTLKPELMRKGRFDEVYFVDFPSKEEAHEILVKTINRYVDAAFYLWENINENVVESLVSMFYQDGCCGFSGAEINALVGAVVEDAFSQFIETFDKTKPGEFEPVVITKQMFEKAIKNMRPHAMSRQLRSNTDSAIKRISRLQNEFGLKSASKK